MVYESIAGMQAASIPSDNFANSENLLYSKIRNDYLIDYQSSRFYGKFLIFE
jgi:hypothetical protein